MVLCSFGTKMNTRIIIQRRPRDLTIEKWLYTPNVILLLEYPIEHYPWNLNTLPRLYLTMAAMLPMSGKKDLWLVLATAPAVTSGVMSICAGAATSSGPTTMAWQTMGSCLQDVGVGSTKNLRKNR